MAAKGCTSRVDASRAACNKQSEMLLTGSHLHSCMPQYSKCMVSFKCQSISLRKIAFPAASILPVMLVLFHHHFRIPDGAFCSLSTVRPTRGPPCAASAWPKQQVQQLVRV
jgi:hypothetical protein